MENLKCRNFGIGIFNFALDLSYYPLLKYDIMNPLFRAIEIPDFSKHIKHFSDAEFAFSLFLESAPDYPEVHNPKFRALRSVIMEYLSASQNKAFYELYFKDVIFNNIES